MILHLILFSISDSVLPTSVTLNLPPACVSHMSLSRSSSFKQPAFIHHGALTSEKVSKLISFEWSTSPGPSFRCSWLGWFPSRMIACLKHGGVEEWVSLLSPSHSPPFWLGLQAGLRWTRWHFIIMPAEEGTRSWRTYVVLHAFSHTM